MILADGRDAEREAEDFLASLDVDWDFAFAYGYVEYVIGAVVAYWLFSDDVLFGF